MQNNTLAEAITDRLDEMARHDCNEQHVDGLRANLDLIVAAGTDLTWLADELDVEIPAAVTGTYTPANPMVTITNDHGDIEHMRRSLFAEHFEGLGWWITATPTPKTPVPAAAPIVHSTSVRSVPVDDFSFDSNHTGTCPCGWTSPTTTSSFMVNTWRTEHELADSTADAA